VTSSYISSVLLVRQMIEQNDILSIMHSMTMSVCILNITGYT
jgi:hypothetical protein